MGQDFTAIFQNAIDSNLLTNLPSRLDAEMIAIRKGLIHARLDDVKDAPRTWKWRWDSSLDPPFQQWLASDALGLAGPGSLWLDLGREAAILRCWVRWREFATDKKVQQAMREIVFHLAQLFNAELAIYVPDSSSKAGEGASSMALEGASIADVLEFLSLNGNAAVSLDSICTAVIGAVRLSSEIIECDRYYVDQFEDLKQ